MQGGVDSRHSLIWFIAVLIITFIHFHYQYLHCRPAPPLPSYVCTSCRASGKLSSTLPCLGYCDFCLVHKFSFYYTHKIHTVGVNSRLDGTCYLVGNLIVGVYPEVRPCDLPPLIIFSRRTPPVFSLLIVADPIVGTLVIVLAYFAQLEVSSVARPADALRPVFNFHTLRSLLCPSVDNASC